MPPHVAHDTRRPAGTGRGRAGVHAAVAAGLAAVALALGACGGESTDRQPNAARGGTPAQHVAGDRMRTPAERIQALLARRALALGHDSPRAYAATSAPARRAHDRRAARVAGAVGVRDVRLLGRRIHVDGRRARIDAVAVWRIRGVPGEFRAGRRLGARRTSHGWRIASAPQRRGLAPWDVASYHRYDGRHFVVLAPRDVDVDAAALPATLADGYRAFAAALPHAPLRRRYLVVVAEDAGDARRLTRNIQGIENLQAISDTAVRQSGPAKQVTGVLSQRLLIVWPAFSVLGTEDRRRVVAHELTHLVLAGSTSGRTPSWLVEGIALYVSGDERSDEVSAVLRGAAGSAGTAARPSLSLRRLSRPNAIAHLSGYLQAGAYAYASAAAFAIADTYGRRALLRLYDAFSDPRLRGAPGPELVDRALRRTIGESLAAFESHLRAGLD